MSSVNKIILIFAIICLTHYTFHKSKFNQYLGYSQQQLIFKLGDPDLILELDSSTIILTYIEAKYNSSEAKVANITDFSTEVVAVDYQYTNFIFHPKNNLDTTNVFRSSKQLDSVAFRNELLRFE